VSTFCVLDVGHGSCSVLRTENYCAIFDLGHAATLIDFMQTEGIEKIDCLFISHSDLDHIDGVQGIISSESLEVAKVFLNPDADKDSGSWKDLVTALDDASKSGLSVHTDLNVTLPDIDLDEISVRVIYPSVAAALRGPGATKEGSTATVTQNDHSAVLRLTTDGKGLVLLTGDMSSDAWRQIASNGHEVSATILLLPHHGGSFGTASDYGDLLEKVRPEYAVASNGRSSKFDNPQRETVAAVREFGSKLKCTQLCERCGTHPPSRGCGHNASRGKIRAHSCAGSIQFTIDSSATRMVNEEEHDAFLRLLDAPQCVVMPPPQ
jgi:beta-lactamase superfamily II metal-dependent hydrolase